MRWVLSVMEDPIKALEILYPEGSRQDRIKIFKAVYRLTILIVLVWACGGFQWFGFAGFARADDVDDKINTQIEASVTPIKADLSEIKTQLAKVVADQRSLLIGQAAAKLRDLKRIHCSADSADRQRLDEEIEATEQEFRALAGERLPLPPCDTPKK